MRRAHAGNSRETHRCPYGTFVTASALKKFRTVLCAHKSPYGPVCAQCSVRSIVLTRDRTGDCVDVQWGRSSLHIGFSSGNWFSVIATFVPLMCNEERPHCTSVAPAGFCRRRSRARSDGSRRLPEDLAPCERQAQASCISLRQAHPEKLTKYRTARCEHNGPYGPLCLRAAQRCRQRATAYQARPSSCQPRGTSVSTSLRSSVQRWLPRPS